MLEQKEGPRLGACGKTRAPAEEAYLDALFSDLMHEVTHGAPGARLSARLRAALERLPPGVRRGVAARTRDGCAPLFVAARRGNVELVDYLVHVCAAELEQRGVFTLAHDGSQHRATPLWAAAVAGQLPALRALADAGAALDARSDSGSTPARSACFLAHAAVVRELLARGADAHAPDRGGGTCLINAVHSAPLCALLLAHGARVDAQDQRLKTALHYAAQEQRADTVRLLLAHGADPALRSRDGDDALRAAALRGAGPALELLLAREPAPGARADALELLGATQLGEARDAAAALRSWRRATALRAEHGAAKAGHAAAARALAAAALGGAREWAGAEALEALAADEDALHTQALLVVARVLGDRHPDTVARLVRRGAALAQAARQHECAALWGWALRLRVRRDSLLHADTGAAACALTRLLLAAPAPRHRDVLRAFALLAGRLPGARAQLARRPAPARRAAADRALRCAALLLHLLLRTAPDAAARARVGRRAARLVAADVRSAAGDSLLHLAASRLTADEFPSPRLARELLRAGASARATNAARCTPLHVAAVPRNFSTELVELLLAGGAHLDQPNAFGDSAAELVPLNRASRVCPLRHVSLACLAARAVLAAGVPLPPGALPATLRAFLDLHRA
ncbi:protein fem-1 homolog CG6966 [Bicyclus anynana]|uniref:Protein fem-1 homolog CG6966 n=1 Tax=Bicyclus anynana TaxID=110368 RepID=A0ABM3M153_BICAN|nr:protein fem-1 homolog CG6966 [Bicyclus anynana]